MLYVRIGNCPLKHRRLLDIVKERQKGFPSGQRFEVAALYETIFTECDKETSLVPDYGDNALISHSSSGLYTGSSCP